MTAESFEMSFSTGPKREEDEDMPNEGVGGDIPRMIVVRLNSEDAHFVPAYAWLIEEGCAVQFNASMHSLHGNGQRVIWFKEGGPAPVIESMEDPIIAPVKELKPPMQPPINAAANESIPPMQPAIIAAANESIPPMQLPIIAPRFLPSSSRSDSVIQLNVLMKLGTMQQVRTVAPIQDPIIGPVNEPKPLVQLPFIAIGPVNEPKPPLQPPIIASGDESNPPTHPSIIPPVNQSHQTMQPQDILQVNEPNSEMQPQVNALVAVPNPPMHNQPHQTMQPQYVIPINEPNSEIQPQDALVNVPNPPMQAASFFDRTIPYFQQVYFLLVIYLAVGIGLYISMLNQGGITGADKDSSVDPFYFLMVILSSTGYGDIYPSSTSAKLCTSFLILFGCGLLAGRLTALFNCLSSGFGNIAFGYITQRLGRPISERSTETLKVVFAIIVVILCIFVGLTGGLLEGMGFLDSLCFSIVSVTSVGFGDQHFDSVGGKIFAIFWLPVSTTLVGISFAYLARCGYGSLK